MSDEELNNTCKSALNDLFQVTTSNGIVTVGLPLVTKDTIEIDMNDCVDDEEEVVDYLHDKVSSFVLYYLLS